MAIDCKTATFAVAGNRQLDVTLLGGIVIRPVMGRSITSHDGVFNRRSRAAAECSIWVPGGVVLADEMLREARSLAQEIAGPRTQLRSDWPKAFCAAGSIRANGEGTGPNKTTRASAVPILIR